MTKPWRRYDQKKPEKKHIIFDCSCVNQHDETVITGTATVLAPTEKVRRPRFALPDVSMREHRAGD